MQCLFCNRDILPGELFSMLDKGMIEAAHDKCIDEHPRIRSHFMSDAVDEQLKRNQKGDYEMKEIIDGRRK